MLRTFFDTVCDLQVFRDCRPRLLPCKPIQPLQGVLNICPSTQALHEFLCLEIRKETDVSEELASLILLSCISFIERASMESTSAIILPSIVIMSLVSGIPE